MAFFKFRKGGDDHAAAPSSPAPESLEAMRKRARHRLIGAAVLVLLGVIGFPLLFDSQPRPIAVDIAIEIPDKTKVKPLRSAAPVATASGAVSAKAPEVPPVVVAAPIANAPQAPASSSRVAAGSVSPAAMITEVDPKPAPKVDAKPLSKPVDKSADKTPDKTPTAAETHDVNKKSATTEGRFVVQVGAFSDAAKARDARVKLEKAGLKTYTQVIEAKEGRRIRVRVGPFATKHDAEKAAEKIKKLDLPTGVLEL